MNADGKRVSYWGDRFKQDKFIEELTRNEHLFELSEGDLFPHGCNVLSRLLIRYPIGQTLMTFEMEGDQWSEVTLTRLMKSLEMVINSLAVVFIPQAVAL